MDADAVYQTPTVEEIASILPAKFASVKVTKTETRRVYATVPREDIFAVCTYIHDNLTFEHCTTLLGVDYVDHMSVVYHLSNYYNGVMIELVVDVPVDDLHVESVTSIWEGANWHERETWELFGIVFDNHPKLERLLTPKTYEFFPFRKSYKLRGSE
ncbi:MAG: NADH-quinone oxidoreductase subunit C [Candidatus Methanomethylophilaceae archaeon]|nr:NADH-quinone oxidoreductase subunit C [Candidatus Methanomethylophilaceae archaeon]MBQ8643193.1 NADH-quinone oxidoreductase subunit C [Candidatus Methanomethylophilaceae archaeon]MBR2348654.1 NADH-quinone oxidoreductase subunit C [Candidatus Methanomethylophilaceae archaeon]